jgi:CMP-N-acetylneuraminic acid synthetase
MLGGYNMLDAITFIRLNSQRVPSKSIKPLNGIPLCNYALKVMNKVPEIDNLMVYASNEEISDYIDPSIEYTFKKRPEFLDSDSTTFNDVMDRGIDLIDSKYLVYFCVTSPFMKPATISEMIHRVLMEDYDSSFLAHATQAFTWYNGKPLNYDVKKIISTQALVPVVFETSGLYVFEKECYKGTGQRIGNKPYIKKVGLIEGWDIDYEEEFEIAERLSRGMKNE